MLNETTKRAQVKWTNFTRTTEALIIMSGNRKKGNGMKPMKMKTRKHSSRKRTTRSSSPGGICQLPLKADPSGCRPPRTDQHPAGRPPLLEADCPHPPRHVNCDVCWETIPLVDRMTDTCKSITLPQTSFTGCNNEFGFSLMNCRESYLIFEKNVFYLMCAIAPSRRFR